MKRQILLQIEQDELDNAVLNELKDSLKLVLTPYTDEGGFEIEPDHEVIFGLLEAIKYYSPFNELDNYINSLKEQHEYFEKYTVALDVISTV